MKSIVLAGLTATLLVGCAASDKPGPAAASVAAGYGAPDAEVARVVTGNSLYISSINDLTTRSGVYNQQKLDGAYRLKPGRHRLSVYYEQNLAIGKFASAKDQVIEYDFRPGKTYTLAYVGRDYGREKTLWRAVLYEVSPATKKTVGAALTVSKIEVEPSEFINPGQ